MAKKNRPSVQKREREQKKRQRETAKVAKAAEKRERRFKQKLEMQSVRPLSDAVPIIDRQS
jgi:hypothetical protein